MKLRAQLVVVSLVALLLPWAGCEYVAEMENTLRDGEQDMLGKFAGSVAAYIEGQAALVTALEPAAEVPGAQSLYLFTDRDRGFEIDGYPDDQLNIDTDALRITGADPAAEARVTLSAIGDRVYVYLQFNRPSLRKRGLTSRADNGFDHVELVMGEPDDRRRLFLAPGAAGAFTAERLQGERLIAQYGNEAWWHDDADGYRVEASLPRSWLGEHFGVRVYDASTANEVSTLNAAGEPAYLYQRSELLESSLRHFSSNVNVTLVDANGWIRASKGGADFRQGIERPPAFWLIENLYRRIVRFQQESRPYVPPAGGRLLRQEVDSALTSAAGGASGWYVLGREEGEYASEPADAAVVTSAVRISDRAGNPVGVAVLETSSRGSLSRTSSTLVNVIGIAALVTLLIVLVLVGYATWLSQRVRRLSAQVMTVMEPQGRELRAFPEQTAGDEIGTLGRNFGRLLGRVRGYTDYLQSLASKLSHELRTPLAVVSSSLDNLQHEELNAAAQAYVARARGGSERLSHILTALSEASRVEQAIQSAERQRLDLNELTRDVVAGYRSAWPGQCIELELPEGDVVLDGCPELIAQMLDKLMDNARDFCVEGSAIRFRMWRENGTALLAVENDGPLLPAGMDDELFESMVSVREGRGENLHLGLGLTIVRLIAAFHHGRVVARNRPDATGVVVTVTLQLVGSN